MIKFLQKMKKYNYIKNIVMQLKIIMIIQDEEKKLLMKIEILLIIPLQALVIVIIYF